MYGNIYALLIGNWCKFHAFSLALCNFNMHAHLVMVFSFDSHAFTLVFLCFFFGSCRSNWADVGVTKFFASLTLTLSSSMFHCIYLCWRGGCFGLLFCHAIVVYTCNIFMLFYVLCEQADVSECVLGVCYSQHACISHSCLFYFGLIHKKKKESITTEWTQSIQQQQIHRIFSICIFLLFMYLEYISIQIQTENTRNILEKHRQQYNTTKWMKSIHQPFRLEKKGKKPTTFLHAADDDEEHISPIVNKTSYWILCVQNRSLVVNNNVDFIAYSFRFACHIYSIQECNNTQFYMYIKNNIKTFFCLLHALLNPKTNAHTPYTQHYLSLWYFSQCDYYLKTIPIKTFLYSVGFSHEMISVGSDWSSKDDVTIPLLAHFCFVFYFFLQLNTSFVVIIFICFVLFDNCIERFLFWDREK